MCTLLEQVWGSHSVHNLCEPACIDVVPHCNDRGCTTTVGTTQGSCSDRRMDGWSRCDPLHPFPTLGVEHVPARKSADTITVNEIFRAYAAHGIIALEYHRYWYLWFCLWLRLSHWLVLIQINRRSLTRRWRRISLDGRSTGFNITVSTSALPALPPSFDGLQGLLDSFHRVGSRPWCGQELPFLEAHAIRGSNAHGSMRVPHV